MSSSFIGIVPELKRSLKLSITHLISDDDYSVVLEENGDTIWDVEYVELGVLKSIVGKVGSIVYFEKMTPDQVYRIGLSSIEYKNISIYKIGFDTSTSYESSIITIDSVCIRSIKAHTETSLD